MSRWKASALHLAISAIVIAAVAFALVTLWYPPSLFRVARADHLLLILACADLVAGPLLTLLVYRAGKPGLRFDLTVIAMLQIAFLGYGAYTMWASRPVFLVAAVDRFELVFANQIRAADLAAAAAPYRTLSRARPRLVGLVLPTDPKDNDAVMSAEMAGHPASQLPRLYRDYAQVARQLLARSRPMAQLMAEGPVARSRVEAALTRLRLPEQAVRWVPLDAGRGSAVQLLSSADGQLLGVVDVDPWPEDQTEK